MLFFRSLVRRVILSNIANIYIFTSICIFFVASIFLCIDYSLVPISYVFGMVLLGLGIWQKMKLFEKCRQDLGEEERLRYRQSLITSNKNFQKEQ